MRHTILILLCVCVAVAAFGQEEGDETRLLYGPRLGGTYIVTDPDAFTEDMGTIFSESKSYFPAFSEIGVSSTHLLPLGETEIMLTIQQNLFLGGMDQQMLLPTFSLLVGARTGFGSGLSVGPFVGTGAGSDGVELRFSLAYAASWSFDIRGITLPVKFTFVPWPEYANPRMTLTTGVDFEVVRSSQ
jgi:hypothetical protein